MSENPVTVEQVDREAAAEIVRCGAPGTGNGNKVIAAEIKGGLHDSYHIVQLLARHRLASPPTPDEGLVELVERLRGRLRRATQGQWEVQDGCSWRRIGTPGHNGNVLCPSTYSSTDNHPDLTAGKGEDLYANLELIVEMQNALPALLEALSGVCGRG